MIDDIRSKFLDDAVTRIGRIGDNADHYLLVDVSNLAYRSSYAYAELVNSSGQFSGHVYGSLVALRSAIVNFLPEGVVSIVFCYDGLHSKAPRRLIDAGYKANRKYDDRFNPLDDIKAAFSSLPGIHIDVPEREGDDAIAYAVSQISKPRYILSGDKDLWALKSESVNIISPNLGRMVTKQDIVDHYYVTDPARIPLAKALFGDASDGIKGVDRLIRKQVQDPLNACLLDGSDIVQMICDSNIATQKTKDKVIAARDKIANNLKLTTPIRTGFAPLSYSDGNREQLKSVVDHFELKTLSNTDIWFGGPIVLW